LFVCPWYVGCTDGATEGRPVVVGGFVCPRSVGATDGLHEGDTVGAVGTRDGGGVGARVGGRVVVGLAVVVGGFVWPVNVGCLLGRCVGLADLVGRWVG